jgi:hypothetical protein
VKTSEIPEYDAIFMTGTSPIVLPFYCIENNFFRVKHQLIEKLRALYLKKAEESVSMFRS